MASRGGLRAGAGRKSNASKLMEAGFVADWFTAEYQQIKWKSFLESEDQRIALDATKYLTDRLFGKARQAMTHSGDTDQPLVVRHIGGGLADAMAKARKRVTDAEARGTLKPL